MPIFKNQINDDQESVRVLCIDSLIKIVEVFTKDLNKTHMIPILIQFTRDRAWKVRMNLAKVFPQITVAIGKEITDLKLINIFQSQCQDPEGDVRTVAINSLAKFADKISVSFNYLRIYILLIRIF